MSRPAHVRAIAKAGADGVIVASALVDALGPDGRDIDRLTRLVRELRGATARPTHDLNAATRRTGPTAAPRLTGGTARRHGPPMTGDPSDGAIAPSAPVLRFASQDSAAIRRACSVSPRTTRRKTAATPRGAARGSGKTIIGLPSSSGGSAGRR